MQCGFFVGLKKTRLFAKMHVCVKEGGVKEMECTWSRKGL